MNPQRPALSSLRVAATLALLSPFALLAQSVWTGSVDTAWDNAANWTPSGVPAEDAGAAIVINSGTVAYNGNVSGDLTLGGGGSLTINGGSFSQTAGPAWMNIGNGAGSAGTLTINGGSFSAGTSGNMRVGFGGGTGLLSVTGGTFSPAGLEISATGTLLVGGTGVVNIGATFTTATGVIGVSGGTLNIAGELKPLGADFSVSGGAVNANLVSFDGTANKLNFSGGQITLSSGAFEGVYGDNGYINFTTSSTGTLVLSSVSATSAASLLTSRVRFNDTANAGLFTITDLGGGASSISLTAAAVPEPSSFAALAGAVILGATALRRRRD